MITRGCSTPSPSTTRGRCCSFSSTSTTLPTLPQRLAGHSRKLPPPPQNPGRLPMPGNRQSLRTLTDTSLTALMDTPSAHVGTAALTEKLPQFRRDLCDRERCCLTNDQKYQGLSTRQCPCPSWSSFLASFSKPFYFRELKTVYKVRVRQHRISTVESGARILYLKPPQSDCFWYKILVIVFGMENFGCLPSA